MHTEEVRTMWRDTTGRFARKPEPKPYVPPPIQCSFCSKREPEVICVTGPFVAICDECVRLCQEVIADKQASKQG